MRPQARLFSLKANRPLELSANNLLIKDHVSENSTSPLHGALSSVAQPRRDSFRIIEHGDSQVLAA